jgi:hypothetical protein
MLKKSQWLALLASEVEHAASFKEAPGDTHVEVGDQYLVNYLAGWYSEPYDCPIKKLGMIEEAWEAYVERNA